MGKALLNLQAHVCSDRVAVGDFVLRCEGGQIGNKEEVEEELDQAGFMPDMKGLELFAPQSLHWRCEPC
jgi:hypothetical protein